MAHFHSPRIVTNGLVLALDAANTKSYPGSGTVWRGLGTDVSGSLVNTPSFSSSNGGSILFDGVNESVDSVGTTSSFTFIHSTRIFSISMWVKFTNINKRQFFIGSVLSGLDRGFFIGLEYLPANQYYGTNALRMQTCAAVAGNQVGNVNVSGDNAISDTNWHHITYISDATDNFGKFYVDTVLQSRKTTDPFFNQLGRTSELAATRTMSVGRSNHSSLSLPMDGRVSQVQIYNRSLTLSEIHQNYNATKGRFGL